MASQRTVTDHAQPLTSHQMEFISRTMSATAMLPGHTAQTSLEKVTQTRTEDLQEAEEGLLLPGTVWAVGSSLGGVRRCPQILLGNAVKY